MKIIEILNIPIYNTSVCCLIGGVVKDFEILYEDNKNMFNNETYNAIKEDIGNEDFAGFVSCIKNNSYFLFIREKYINDIYIVIHEIFHLTNHILWDRDVDIDKKGEAYAYLIGWLSEQYFNIVNNEERKEIDEAIDNNIRNV